jgi:hypothetical protein
MIFYNSLFRAKFQYASVAWNSVILTDSSKLERIQREFAALCCSRFLIGTCDNTYNDVSVKLYLPTLQSRRELLDALFLISVVKNKPSCSSIFDTVTLSVHARLIRDFSTFDVRHRAKVIPSARCVSAASTLCRYIDIFNGQSLSLIHSIKSVNDTCNNILGFSFTHLMLFYSV